MDDTLVLMKKSDVLIVLQALPVFHKNLDFAVDTFEDKKVLFISFFKKVFFRSFDRQKYYRHIL